MALRNDDVSMALESPNDRGIFALHTQLYAIYNRLKKSLNYARRCSEGFRTTHWKWYLLRLKISERLAYLCDIARISAHELFLEAATQLLEDLLQDRYIVEELITIFNEYLGYAADIKRIIEDTHPGNLSEIAFSLVKELYPELLYLLKSVESSTEKLKIFGLVSLLEMHVADVVGGGDDVLSKTMELLKFLSFHWDIIGELTFIDQNKGPVQDVNLIPERFLENTMPEERKPTYYDLVSNLSVSSAVKCAVDELLSASAEEWMQQGHDKLAKLQQAVDNRTRRMGLLVELLISET